MVYQTQIIVVPHDLTAMGDHALEYALMITNLLKYKIVLIHVANDEKQMQKAKTMLEKSVVALNHNQTEIEVMVVNGSIYKTINDTSESLRASMVVMGTHGMKGMQKLMGSKALKVISHSSVPYIVIQGKPEKANFDHIVFPVGPKKEDKEKLNWAYYMARNFGSKIHVLKASKKDPALKRLLESNINFCKKYFIKVNMKYEIHEASGTASFSKEMLDLARKVGAQMVMIMVTKNLNVTDYILGASEQGLISNSYQIPVMCINPKPATMVSGFSASG